MTDESDPVVLPRGVVTFLLTDVANSTRWWLDGGPGAAAAMARQAEIIATAVAGHGGVRPVEQGEGDSVVAVFERAVDAMAAAIDAQHALAAEAWSGPAVAVRMAVHSGDAEMRDEHTYGGAAIIRCARLRDHAEGGQVLVSAATAELGAERLPAGTALVPVGEVSLRGLPRPERVHQLVHEALGAPIADLGRRADRLGTWPTPIIGRAGERTEVAALLERARLVTIAGAGGAGKTCLAHVVAGDLTGRYGDVVWVELARVTTESDVVAAVARRVGAAQTPGVDITDVLLAYLAGKDVLIVLDNCEHLLGPCAALAERILRDTQHVRLLATSREPLGVTGEVTWRIPSLEMPPESVTDPLAVGSFDAVQLFVARARDALPTFVLDTATAGDVASVCRRLDGLPLAIELAAARLRSMTLRTITLGLDDRFRLLTGGSRTALPRQQTLAASVDWSYGLCDEGEQQLLRALSVFMGPFGLEAAEVIADGAGADRLAVFDLLARLVDKSLVQPAGERFRLLETIRQFALERAAAQGELAQLRDAHLQWFTGRAAGWRVDTELLTETTMREIAAESPDLLTALEWSLNSGKGAVVSLLWPLGSHWLAQSSFAEASRVADLVAEHLEPGSEEWFDALVPLAAGLTMARDRRWMDEARAKLAIEPVPAGIGLEDRMAAAVIAGELGTASAISLGSPGRTPYLQWSAASAPGIFIPLAHDGHTDDALHRLESVVQAGRQTGNRAMEYGGAAMLAYACAAAGAVEKAHPWCDWLDRHLPADAWARTTLSVARGYLALFSCDFDTARQFVSRSVRRQPPDLASAALTGLVGAYTLDHRLLDVGLDVFDATQSSAAYVPWSLVLRSIEAILDGRLSDARAILEPPHQDGFALNQSPLNERLRVQLALATGDIPAAEDKLARLRNMLYVRTGEGRVAYPYPGAGFHLVQADVAVATGEHREAEESVHRALAISGAGLPLITVDALELLAVVLAQRNRMTDAAHLLGATQRFRDGTGYRFRFPLRHLQIKELRAQLDTDQLEAGAGLGLDGALALARAGRGKRGRPKSGWDSLTPTELRVTELVATGCSNAEIADKLLVGIATVKTHLVHVYEKLAVGSRAELAAAAARKEPTC